LQTKVVKFKGNIRRYHWFDRG